MHHMDASGCCIVLGASQQHMLPVFALPCSPNTAALASCPAIATALWSQAESVFFNTPNLHFIPVNPMASSFKNDVYWATSEPHGNIECVVTRGDATPHASKL